MTDAVAGPGIDGPEPTRRPFQIEVIVRVAESRLEQVVIDIDHGERLDPLEADRLELQENQGPGGVVGERLIRVDDQRAVFGPNAVTIQDFLKQIHAHDRLSLFHAAGPVFLIPFRPSRIDRTIGKISVIRARTINTSAMGRV